MKSFIILILLVVLIGENIYIYKNPETVCSELQAKMQALKQSAKSKGAEWVKDIIDDEVHIPEAE